MGLSGFAISDPLGADGERPSSPKPPKINKGGLIQGRDSIRVASMPETDGRVNILGLTRPAFEALAGRGIPSRALGRIYKRARRRQPHPLQSRFRPVGPAPSEAEIESFARSLQAVGAFVKLRSPRGRGLQAACGQLGRVD
jgi:hypothetical protein